MSNTALAEGDILLGSKYKILKELSAGGFGITYMAVQTGLGRKVAVKEFYMDKTCSRNPTTSFVETPDPNNTILFSKFKSRFLKEARTIAELSSNRIVKIIDVFEERNTAYYVMEYYEHGSLGNYIRTNGAQNEAKAIKLIKQIGEALEYIHERNILHLDVKPDNVMFRGEDDLVLIDFGLAKHFTIAGDQTTRAEEALFSRGYAPLEQYSADGVSTFSPATDIYALGATLFFMLTGQKPPEATGRTDNSLPPFPTGVSVRTADAVRAAMTPNMAKRPQHVSEFMKMLIGESSAGTQENTAAWRQTIEIMIAKGDYEPAYQACLQKITEGQDVEFARDKVAQILPKMQKFSNLRDTAMNVVLIVGTISTVLFTLSLIISVL